MVRMSLARKIYQAVAVAGMLGTLFGCGCDQAVNRSAAVAVVDITSIPSISPSPTQSDSASLQSSVAGVIVQAGDSIGVGVGADDWAAIDHLGFSSGVIIRNVSVSGKAMQTGYGYRVRELFPFRSQTSPSILLIQQGTNDLYYGTTANTLYRGIATPFIADAKKAGFYVVIDTILPRSDSGWTPVMERERIAYNALVRGNRANADAVNDLASDSVMGDGSNLVNAAFYADGAHPSLIGQQRLAVLNAAVLRPFLSWPVRPLSR